MDNNRKEYKALQAYLIIGIIIIIISCIMLYVGNFIIGSIILIFGSSYIVKYNERTKFLNKDYQEKVIYNIFVNNFGENNFQYNSISPITKSDYLKSGKTLGDKFISHDYVKANVSDVVIDFSDVLITKEIEKEGKELRTKIIFSGMFIRIFTKLQIDCKIKIFKKDLNIEMEDNYKQLLTNNPEFDKIFDVFSTKKTDILNSQVLENILLLEKKYPQNFYLSYLDNCIYLTISNNGNLFPLKEQYTDNEKKTIAKEIHQLSKIVKFIKTI